MRVVQGGDGTSFAFKPLLQIRIGGDMFWQHLDGDGAVQAGVGCFVDLAPMPLAPSVMPGYRGMATQLRLFTEDFLRTWSPRNFRMAT